MKSIIPDDVENICYLCKRYGDHLDVHHIFEGTGRRKASDRHNLIVHLCRSCHSRLHDKNEGMDYLHRIGQQAYEEQIGTKEEFIKEFIRSYL